MYYDEDYNDYEDIDYESETFDALTDGMDGDYEDWREGGGDIDSLKDALGF